MAAGENVGAGSCAIWNVTLSMMFALSPETPVCTKRRMCVAAALTVTWPEYSDGDVAVGETDAISFVTLPRMS